MRVSAALLLACLGVAPVALAQSFYCERELHLEDSQTACLKFGPDLPPASVAEPVPEPPSPIWSRLQRYARLTSEHKLCGLASYYSQSLDGTLTANGERYHAHRLSAAHLTLPLGSWVEISARATGRTIRCRVNDRGPYSEKFVIDLSREAARQLGVDEAEDRHVDIRVVALPGEDPLPPDSNWFGLDEEEALPGSATASE